MGESVNTVLYGGPLDGQAQSVKMDPEGVPPERIDCMDSIATMESVIASEKGAAVPITYHTYLRKHGSPAGIWRYEYDGSRSGRFTTEA